MSFVKCIYRYSVHVVWQQSGLDFCPMSRLVGPVSALLVTLALSIRLRAARCSPYGRQKMVW